MDEPSAGEAIPIFTWNRVGASAEVIAPLGDDFAELPPIAVRSIHHPEKETEKRTIRSLRMESPRGVGVREFYFAPQISLTVEKGQYSPSRPAPHYAAVPTELPSEYEHLEKVTRLKVPTDAVKIEDRLHYILAPPLETLLKSESLELPFAPFAYQKQGISFLYSSHFAILADQMGLGKTMQAIVTVRLLLKSGECRRVLLVCPKPLVPNYSGTVNSSILLSSGESIVSTWSFWTNHSGSRTVTAPPSKPSQRSPVSETGR